MHINEDVPVLLTVSNQHYHSNRDFLKKKEGLFFFFF